MTATDEYVRLMENLGPGELALLRSTVGQDLNETV